MGEWGRASSTEVTEINLHQVLSIIEKDLNAPKSFITGGTSSLVLDAYQNGQAFMLL